MEGHPVPSTTTKKFTPEIDAQLYEEMVAVAKQNGQPQRYMLERALEFYLHNVAPSHRLVRPEVLEASRRSNEQYRKLSEKLAHTKYMAQRVYLTVAEALANAC